MSSDPEHPTYANPTIVEALCHLDFEPSKDSEWQIGRPTKFLQLVGDEYPSFEPVPNPGFTLGPTGSPTLRIGAALRLSTEDRRRYIAVGDRHFAFGHLARYPGWESFRHKLLSAWAKFAELARPHEISRVGLRYINMIPRTSQHPLVSDWLMPTATLPGSRVNAFGRCS
jgi:uncharacterized protein (TIGR04255 family)